jgi:hypothetical protein
MSGKFGIAGDVLMQIPEREGDAATRGISVFPRPVGDSAPKTSWI